MLVVVAGGRKTRPQAELWQGYPLVLYKTIVYKYYIILLGVRVNYILCLLILKSQTRIITLEFFKIETYDNANLSS